MPERASKLSLESAGSRNMFALRLTRNWSGKGARAISLAILLSLSTCAQPAYAHSLMDDLEKVNWRVNGLPLSDCKSFAFEKEARLRKQGIKGKILIVLTEAGEGHAILVVDSRYVLDNRFKSVVTVHDLRKLGYQIAQLPGER